MKDTDRKGFASKVAASYKEGGDGEATDEGAEGDDAALQESAGAELADALKSGDGKRIYEAFEALNELCKGG